MDIQTLILIVIAGLIVASLLKTLAYIIGFAAGYFSRNLGPSLSQPMKVKSLGEMAGMSLADVYKRN